MNDTAGYFSSPTPTPFPNFIAHNALEAAQIQLLHQIQNHTLSVRDIYLYTISYSLPIPLSWKFDVYHFLISLPFPQLTPWEFLALITVGPILSLIFIYFFIRFLLHIVPIVTALIMRLFTHKLQEKENKVFLELRFPTDTTKSAYATTQLYGLLHGLSRQKSFLQKITHFKKTYSFEIVATKKIGIRYIMVVAEKEKEIITHSLRSYLPGIQIQTITDYILPQELTGYKSIAELKLSDDFMLPLKNQDVLSEHDPMSYLTGHMTQLGQDELVAFQIIATPVVSRTHQDVINEMTMLRSHMYKREPITSSLQKTPLDTFFALPGVSFLWAIIRFCFTIIKYVSIFIFSMLMAFLDHRSEAIPFLAKSEIKISTEILNPYEQELQKIVKEKIDQQLFETTIRILIVSPDKNEEGRRLSGLMASFNLMTTSYQSIITKGTFLGLPKFKKRFKQFINREISSNTRLNRNPILSSSEIADIYHFPYTDTTKTEDMYKLISPKLPAPLVLKNADSLDIIFGQNTYGSTPIPIGLTDDERSRHVYLIGQTGSGKSTILYHSAKDDIQKGQGVAVIDPHGDLVTDLLSTIPLERMNDVVYLNPFDIKHPININLLELTPGLDEDELELEKELVAESVISIFRRVFDQDEQNNAHRIERVLRNTIYTAFYVKGATIFTVNKLLTNETFRNKVLTTVDDDNLLDFWKGEFGKAGGYQVFKMIDGVTAKVERFLFSPIAKRILEQPKSTIYFDQLLDKGKIILCNLSEGKIGEDTSQLLGTTILTKIHLSMLKRARMEKALRQPFYLYVDEFQNFATKSFTKLLSGGRKFGLRITIAEQSTAQQSDNRITDVILANVGTVICFRTASPVDEEIMLAQFHPLIKKGSLGNLPRFHFYIKLGSIEPQEPFSGETLPVTIVKDEIKIEKIIAASRSNYATVYVRAPKKIKPKKTSQPVVKGQTKPKKKSKDVSSLTT